MKAMCICSGLLLSALPLVKQIRRWKSETNVENAIARQSDRDVGGGEV